MPDANAAQPVPAPQTAPPNGTPDDARAWENAKAEAFKAPEQGKNGKATAKKEDAPPPPPEKTEEDKRVSYREWKRYHEKRQRLEAREAEYAQRVERAKAEDSAREARGRELDDRSKMLDALEADPRALIAYIAKKQGISETKAINYINSYVLEGKTPVEQELDRMKADQRRRDEEQAKREKDEKQRREDDDRTAQQIKVSNYITEIARYVTQHADDYVHLPAFSAELVGQSAWERIKAHWEKTGISLPLDKVLATLESEEEQRYLVREGRRNKRLGAPPLEDPREGKATPANRESAQRPATLNNQLATQRSTGRQVSDDEDWQAIMRAAGIRR